MRAGTTLRDYGPWALVTGASSGMGEQFARQLADGGINLLLVARRADRLERLRSELQQAHGIDVELLVLDLARPETVARILAAAASRDIGLVVSNAGFGLKGAFTSHEAGSLDAMLNVNARVPLLLVHGLLPQLARRPVAGVILTGSQEGEAPFPWSAAYAATKAFVHSLGQSLHGECRGTGVDVLVLAPGATDTEALALQGFDASQLPGLMSPGEVVRQALARLGHAPLHIPGVVNRLFVRLFRMLPRRQAIALAGKSMASALERAGHPVQKA